MIVKKYAKTLRAIFGWDDDEKSSVELIYIPLGAEGKLIIVVAF